MSAHLHVCPLSRLAATARGCRAGHLVSILSPGADAAARPADIPPQRHLRLTLSDIATPRDGLRLAGTADVVALLAFARTWDREKPMLIHCYAGVSRSTAAVLAVLCALQPHRPEADMAAALRAASPTATPNPRLLALADEQLGRDGRLVAAAAAIGRGADCFEGTPFCLPVEA